MTSARTRCRSASSRSVCATRTWRCAMRCFPAMPVVLGQEGAGVVEQVGSQVTKVAVGDHVVMSAAYCGHCMQCLTGHQAYCENSFPENFGGRRTLAGTSSLTSQSGEVVSSHFFGQSSFSTYANVVESSLIPVDRSLPLESIAFLGCGMQTGAGSILNELRPPGEVEHRHRRHRRGRARRRDGCPRLGLHDDHRDRPSSEPGGSGPRSRGHARNQRPGRGCAEGGAAPDRRARCVRSCDCCDRAIRRPGRGPAVARVHRCARLQPGRRRSGGRIFLSTGPSPMPDPKRTY